MFEVHRQTYCRDGIWCTFLWNPEFHAEARKGGEISFDNAGCLECGSCRVMCKKEGVIEWPYPRGTFGVDFRCG